MGTRHLALVQDDAAPVRAVESTVAAAPQRVRIVDGTLRCIARQGVAKTTVDDVAREAGCSRATVYRVFPGGKDEVLAAVGDTELARLLSAMAVPMGAADDIEDVLVAGIGESVRWLSGHRALQFLLEHEPEQLLPHLAFGEMDELLLAASRFTGPFLGRWLAPDEATRVAEWAARIVISYLLCPGDGVDLTDTGCVRRLVRTFMVPGILAMRGGAVAPAHDGVRSEPDPTRATATRSTAARPTSTRRTTTRPRPTTTKGEPA